MSNNNIPLLNPVLFQEELIDKNWSTAKKLDDFFIHSFKDDVVPLKLPLPLHKKTVNDFVLLTDGTMTKTIGLESFSLRPNQFLFTCKNSITTTQDVSDELAGFYCHFSDIFIGNTPFLKQWKTQPVLQSLLQLKPEEINTLLPLLERMACLYRTANNKPQNYKLIHYYLAVFLAEVSIISKSKPKETTASPLFQAFRQMANERFKESRSVQYFAGLLHVSANHLNKVVKRETGKTASDFINNICILEAKVLISQTQADISELAYDLGFEDTSYFSRFFKKYTGLSPTNYRKMIDLS